MKRSFRAQKHESEEEVCFPSFDAIVKAEIRDDLREHRALIHTELRFCTENGCSEREIWLHFVLVQFETVSRRANVANALETHANRDFREDFFSRERVFASERTQREGQRRAKRERGGLHEQLLLLLLLY